MCYICKQCLRLAIESPSYSKERLRYIPESTLLGLSFYYLFIIASYQTFTSSIPNMFESLDNVLATAKLMINLAPDMEHSAHSQGSLLLRRAEDLKAILEQGSRSESRGTNYETPMESSVAQIDFESQEFTHEALMLSLNSEGIFGIEPSWDFSMLIPNIDI